MNNILTHIVRMGETLDRMMLNIMQTNFQEISKMIAWTKKGKSISQVQFVFE